MVNCMILYNYDNSVIYYATDAKYYLGLYISNKFSSIVYMFLFASSNSRVQVVKHVLNS